MPTPRTRSASEAPSLSTKKQPIQQRSTQTYERILNLTAEVLADVGVERLSTNLVCERAGLSPPALYRYFPNKYALLNELGLRLMQAQNEVVPRWISPEVLRGPVSELEAALVGLVLETYSVTKRTTGGVWILRALRAVPTLLQIRLDSHDQVSKAQTLLLKEAFPNVPQKELAIVGRVAVDLLYSTVELLFDTPLNARAVAAIAAAMVASHMDRLRKNY